MKNDNMQTKPETSDEQESGSALRDAACCASFESCDAPHPDAWSYKRCNREKGHGGEHACIEHYSGRQNEWWKGES